MTFRLDFSYLMGFAFRSSHMLKRAWRKAVLCSLSWNRTYPLGDSCGFMKDVWVSIPIHFFPMKFPHAISAKCPEATEQRAPGSDIGWQSGHFPLNWSRVSRRTRGNPCDLMFQYVKWRHLMDMISSHELLYSPCKHVVRSEVSAWCTTLWKYILCINNCQDENNIHI